MIRVKLEFAIGMSKDDEAAKIDKELAGKIVAIAVVMYGFLHWTAGVI